MQRNTFVVKSVDTLDDRQNVVGDDIPRRTSKVYVLPRLIALILSRNSTSFAMLSLVCYLFSYLPPSIPSSSRNSFAPLHATLVFSITYVGVLALDQISQRVRVPALDQQRVGKLFEHAAPFVQVVELKTVEPTAGGFNGLPRRHRLPKLVGVE